MKNFLYKLYIAVVFLIIFSLTILFRLFRSKEEVLLENFIGNISNFTLFLYFFFGLFQFVIIVIILRHFYKSYFHINRQSSIFYFFDKYFGIIYKKPMEYVYNLTSDYMPGILFIKIINFIDKDRSSNRIKQLIEFSYYNSIWLFYFFPQIFCAVVFLYEIVFCHKLHYFFFAMILLIISIIYDLFINLGITFAEKSYPGFLEFINVEGFDMNNDGVYTNFKFSWKTDYSYGSEAQLNEFAENYFMVQSIEAHNREILERKFHYFNFVLLFTSCCYFVGSFYRLVFILFP